MTPDTERMVLEALRECADDLEAEIKGRVGSVALSYPTLKRKFDRDMEPVTKARAALSAADREAQSGGTLHFKGDTVAQMWFQAGQMAAAATIERLTRELAEARDAIYFAADAGFEWPADPMPRKDPTDGHS
jgi:hypothetical protein